FFFSSRSRHTRSYGDWSSDVCSSDLGRSSDRTADDQDRGAAVKRHFRRNHSLLVRGLGARRANTRNDEEAVGPDRSCPGNLGPGADDAVDAAIERKERQSLNWLGGRTVDARHGEVALVEAGENRHPDNL